jgi:hypothetical protein
MVVFDRIFTISIIESNTTGWKWEDNIKMDLQKI